MNRKVLLGVVIVLTLITAGIHLTLGSGMLFGGPPGGSAGGANRQFQNGGTPAAGGQFPQGGGGNGGGNGQGNGQGSGGGQGQRLGGPGRDGLGFALFRYLPILFLLNTLGYLFLLALLVFKAPYFRDHAALTHGLLMGFAAVTFIAYFAVMGFGGILRNPSALVAKVDEILLIVFTFLHLRAVLASKAAAPPAAPAAAA